MPSRARIAPAPRLRKGRVASEGRCGNDECELASVPYQMQVACPLPGVSRASAVRLRGREAGLAQEKQAPVRGEPAASEIDCELPGPDRWKIEGKVAIVGHGGCGTGSGGSQIAPITNCCATSMPYAMLSTLPIGDRICSACRDRGHRRIAVRAGAVQRGPAQVGQVKGAGRNSASRRFGEERSSAIPDRRSINSWGDRNRRTKSLLDKLQLPNDLARCPRSRVSDRIGSIWLSICCHSDMLNGVARRLETVRPDRLN